MRQKSLDPLSMYSLYALDYDEVLHLKIIMIQSQILS